MRECLLTRVRQSLTIGSAMATKEHTEAIEAVTRARDIVGGTAALARKLDVTPTTVSEWVGGKRRVPLERCPQIELATGGQVMRHELRPDIDWSMFGAPPTPSADPPSHSEAA